MYYGGQAPLLPELVSTTLSSSASLIPILSSSTSATVQIDHTPTALSPIPSISTAPIDSHSFSTTFSAQASPSNPSSIVVTPSSSAELESPMLPGVAVAFWSTFASIFTTGGVLRYIDQSVTKSKYEERKEDPTWIASSKSWVDRTLCRTIGICGLTHLNKSKWKTELFNFSGFHDTSSFWTSGEEDPTSWSDLERLKREIPQYVLDHAPFVHLYSSETYWPGDMAEHLLHTTAHLNYTPAPEKWQHLNIANLDKLNDFGPQVFLQSDDNVEDNPDWLLGEQNIPDKSDLPFDLHRLSHHPAKIGHWKFHPDTPIADPDFDEYYDVGNDTSPTEDNPRLPYDPNFRFRAQDDRSAQVQSSEKLRQLSPGGRSNAPVVMLVVDKGNDVVDAFWFYFYSYNLGNQVFGVRFGNHVGDWEHTAIRFHKGQPKLVFFSEHDFGEAYSWEAVEKYGDRPVSYSAVGTHAMYGTPGTHTYVLPFGILYDMTDRGPLWDPVLNMYSYTYDFKKDILRSSTLNPQAPTSWFHFWGHWGDKFYPLSDPRQYRFLGQYHYVNGPIGPRFKRLGRQHICQGGDSEPCNIRTWFNARDVSAKWKSAGEGEDISEEDLKRFAVERKLELRRTESAFRRFRA